MEAAGTWDAFSSGPCVGDSGEWRGASDADRGSDRIFDGDDVCGECDERGDDQAECESVIGECDGELEFASGRGATEAGAELAGVGASGDESSGGLFPRNGRERGECDDGTVFGSVMTFRG
jgi:hypothetical protein